MRLPRESHSNIVFVIICVFLGRLFHLLLLVVLFSQNEFQGKILGLCHGLYGIHEETQQHASDY